jgi:AI-2 transport protein TqsA
VSEPVPERSGLPRGLSLLLGGAAALVIAFGLRELGWLFAPVFLALVIVLLVHPLHEWMRRKGVPAVLALLGLLIAIFGVVLALAAIIALAVVRLAGALPAYASNATGLVTAIGAWLQGFGISSEQIQGFLSNVDIERVAGWLTALSNSVINFGANVIFLLTLLLFLGIDAAGASARMNTLMATRPQLAAALRNFASQTRRFLGVTTLFALIIGLIDTLVLMGLGIEYPVLWGLLAVVCTYIPYVGFALALIPPALLALLGGDWQLMVVVIVVYVVVNSLFPSLVPPYFVGDAVGLSVPVTLLAVVFWSWVLGPLGSVLGLPMTLLVKAVLVDSDPRAAWANAFLESTNPRRRRGLDPG